MSDTLEKAPSEGDVNDISAEDPAKEPTSTQKPIIRKTKSIGKLSDLGRVATVDSIKPTSGVRLVWRTEYCADLDNLSKVLGISKSSKRGRSLSPRPAPKDYSDHVFSENFDPLAVRRRPSINPEDLSALELESNSENSEIFSVSQQKEKFRRKDSDFKKIEMPSVKSLKSVFEGLNKESEESRQRSTQVRVASLSEADLSSRKQKEYKRDQFRYSKTDKPTEKTHQRDGQDATANDKQTSFKEPATTDSKIKEIKTFPPINKDNFHSMNVDAEHLKPVKSLLSIFERSQSIPSNLNSVESIKVKKSYKKKSLSISDTTIIAHDTIDKQKNQKVANDTASEGYVKSKEKLRKCLSETGIMTHAEKINTRETLSVLSLKNKWESLLQRNTNQKYVKKESIRVSKREKDTQLKKKTEGEEKKETSLVTANKLDEQVKIDKSVSDQPKHLEKSKETGEEISHKKLTELPSFSRRNTSYSSVRDIVHLYESEKLEGGPQNPANSLFSPTSKKKIQIDLFRPTEIRNEFASPASPITSKKVNRRDPSKSLEDLKKRFKTEYEYVDPQEKTFQNDKLKISPENKREMSLGSLERKESVKKLKKQFEKLENISSTEREIKKSIFPTMSENDTMKEASPQAHNDVSNSNTVKITPAFENADIPKEKQYENIKKETELRKIDPNESTTEVGRGNEINKNDTNELDITKDGVVENVPVNKTRTEEKDKQASSSTIATQNSLTDGSENENKIIDKQTNAVTTKEENSEVDRDMLPELNSSVVGTYFMNKRSSNEPKANYPEKEKVKIEQLVKEFIKSEGLSNYLEVPKEEYVSPVFDFESEGRHDSSNLMETKDSLEYPGELYSSPDRQTDTEATSALPPITSPKDLMAKVLSGSHGNHSRNGSRDLKPDELQFFKDPSIYKDEEETPKCKEQLAKSSWRRERSSTIESDSPSSILHKDFTKSKLRSSSRQLHADELRFFGVSFNGTTSTMSQKGSDGQMTRSFNGTTSTMSQKGSDGQMRKEVLGKVFRATSVDAGGGRHE